MRRLLLVLLLSLFLSGCVSAVTRRVDTLSEQLAATQHQFDHLSQQMDAGIAQLTRLNQQIEKTNDHFEQFEKSMGRFPFFGPATPPKGP